LVAGRAPADLPPFENGDAGAETRGLQCHREPGEPRADHADVDIQIEGKAQPLRHAGGILSVGRVRGGFAHPVFLRTCRALVTLYDRHDLWRISDAKGTAKS